MVFKSFRINVIVRVLITSGTLYLLFYLILQTSFYAATLIVGLTLIYQIYALIHYVEKTNRDLTRFLDAVKHSDFSQSFSGAGLGSSFDSLKEAFSEVFAKFREARAEKEEHFRYLQTVVQHVGVGLIVFQRNGEVELINTAAKRLLHTPHLRNMRALDRFSAGLADKLLEMRPGEKKLIQVSEDDDLLQIAVYSTEFRLREQNFVLVSLQNIQAELEEKEMEAWQNLIRVLTHEIMNSVTPIASLASTANDLLDGVNDSKAMRELSDDDKENVEDISGALQTISKRSQGLLHFVESYRNLTRIPKPEFKIFSIMQLFEDIRLLLKQKFSDAGVELEIAVMPHTLDLTADPELIEQVLINLLVNALHAVERCAHPMVRMSARINERSRVVIQVADNGTGIMQEVQAKIFIPFFTTKQKGSGIGLSLSRQIMRLHGGSINVFSIPNERTVFTLRF